MEHVTANVIGKVRRATVGDRSFLVAPVTLIVPGVLNGSQGPLYYPRDEVAKNVAAWNGVPIVVRHPQSADGKHVSARDPEVLHNQGIGHVYKARANGKLRAEGWFDIEASRRIAPRVLENLQAGRPIEVSTGLYTENEPARNGANWRGKSYTHVARNYRPDHLAILPDEEGACSVKDGCGVNVNQTMNQNSESEGGRDMSKSLSDKAKKTIIDNLIGNCADCGWVEEDRETLNALPDEKLMTMDECRKAVVVKNQRLQTAESKVKELELAVNEANTAATANAQKADADKAKADPPKSKTDDEWLKDAPPRIQSAVRNAMAIEARERQELISRLTANIEDADAKARLVKRLESKPVEELQDLLALAPKDAEPVPLAVNYAGAAAGAPMVNKAKLTYMGLPSEYLPPTTAKTGK